MPCAIVKRALKIQSIKIQSACCVLEKTAYLKLATANKKV